MPEIPTTDIERRIAELLYHEGAAAAWAGDVAVKLVRELNLT